jgi:hypothetical protein
MEIGAKRAELRGFLENGTLYVNANVDNLHKQKQ